jgi:dTMP kinase
LSTAPVVVAVEGIDRAGKTTQTTLLQQALDGRGLHVDVLSFPRYGSFFGRRIRMLLDGHGPAAADTVDPHSMALWYALDRWDAFQQLSPGLDVVLLNRYTLSNAVYQASRAQPEQADALFDWIIELEHERLGLPRPHLTVVLDIGPDLSRRRSSGGARPEAADVYERSVELLQRARERYRAAAVRLDDVVLVGSGDQSGPPLDAAAVHTEVQRAVDERLGACLATGERSGG